MKAYSFDLRERVAAVYAEPGAKIYEVAARLAVSLSFANELLRRQRTGGSLAALPAGRSPTPLVGPPGREQLRPSLVAQPDATLDELRTLLAAVGEGRPCAARRLGGPPRAWAGDAKKAPTPLNVIRPAS